MEQTTKDVVINYIEEKIYELQNEQKKHNEDGNYGSAQIARKKVRDLEDALDVIEE